MTIRKNVALIVLIVVATQISLKHGELTARNIYLSNLKRAKRNTFQETFLPPKRSRTRPQKGYNVMSGKHSSLQKSMYKFYNFPEIEYPLNNFHGNPFYNEKYSNIYQTDSFFPPSKQNSAITDFKKEKRMRRKLQKLSSDQNYHTKREMSPMATPSTTFDSLYLKTMNEFPEVQYPINAMETWIPSYWNTNGEKLEPPYLPAPIPRKKSKRIYEFNKQPLQLIEKLKSKEDKKKNNNKTTTREVHSITEQNSSGSKIIVKSGEIYHGDNLLKGKQNNSIEEIVNFHERSQGTSLNTLTVCNITLNDNVNVTKSVATKINPDIVLPALAPLNINENVKGENNVVKMKSNEITPSQTNIDTGPWNVKIPIPLAETTDDMTINNTVTKQDSDKPGRSVIIVPINIKIISEASQPKSLLRTGDITTVNNIDVLTNSMKEPTFYNENDELSLQMKSRELVQEVPDNHILNTVENTKNILDDISEYTNNFPGNLVINQDLPFIYTKSEDQNKENGSHPVLSTIPEQVVLSILEKDQSPEIMLTIEDMPFLRVTQEPKKPIEVSTSMSESEDLQNDLSDTETNNLKLNLSDLRKGDSENAQLKQMFSVKNVSQNLDSVTIKTALQMFSKSFLNGTQDNNNLSSNKITDILQLFLNKWSSTVDKAVVNNAIKENSDTDDNKDNKIITKIQLSNASKNDFLSYITKLETILINKTIPTEVVSIPQVLKPSNICKYSQVHANSQNFTRSNNKTTTILKQEGRFYDISPGNENTNDTEINLITNTDKSSSSLYLEAYDPINEEPQYETQKQRLDTNKTASFKKVPWWNQTLPGEGSKGMKINNNFRYIPIPYILPDIWTLVTLLHNSVKSLESEKPTSTINITVPEVLSENNFEPKDIFYTTMLPLHYEDMNINNSQTKQQDFRTLKDEPALEQEVIHFTDDIQNQTKDMDIRDLSLTDVIDLELPVTTDIKSPNNKNPTNTESFQNDVIAELKKEFSHFLHTEIEEDNVKFLLKYLTTLKHMKKIMQEEHAHGAFVNSYNERNSPLLTHKSLEGTEGIDLFQDSDVNKYYPQFLLNASISCDGKDTAVPVNVSQFINAIENNSFIGIGDTLVDTRDAILPFLNAGLNVVEEHVSSGNEQSDLLSNKLENEALFLIDNEDRNNDNIRDRPIRTIDDSKVDNSNSTLLMKSLAPILPVTDNISNIIYFKNSNSSNNASEKLDKTITKYFLLNFFKGVSNDSMNDVKKMKIRTKAQDHYLPANFITNALQLFLKKLRIQLNHTMEMKVETNATKEDPAPDVNTIYKVIPDYEGISDNKYDLSSSIHPLGNQEIQGKKPFVTAINALQPEKNDDIAAADGNKNNVLNVQEFNNQYVPPHMLTDRVPLRQITTPAQDINLRNLKFHHLKRGLQGFLRILDEYTNAVDNRSSAHQANQSKSVNAAEKYVKQKNHNMEKIMADDRIINASDTFITIPPLVNVYKDESFPWLTDNIKEITPSTEQAKTTVDDFNKSISHLAMEDDNICNRKIEDTQNAVIVDDNVQSDNMVNDINKKILLRNWTLTAYTTSKKSQSVNASKQINTTDDIHEIPIAYMLPDNFWTLIGLKLNPAVIDDNLISTRHSMMPKNERNDEFKSVNGSVDKLKNLDVIKNSIHKNDLFIIDQSAMEPEIIQLPDKIQDKRKDKETTDFLFNDVSDIQLPLANNTALSNNKTITDTHDIDVKTLLKQEFLDYLFNEVEENNIKFLLKYLVTLKNKNRNTKLKPAETSHVNTDDFGQ